MRRLALINGWSLILMAIIAGFALGYAYPVFFSAEGSSDLESLIIDQGGLYSFMLVGIGIILILDYLLSCTLYAFYKPVNSRLSAYTGIARFVYTLIFSVAAYFLLFNALDKSQGTVMMIENAEKFQLIWNLGLTLFGIHLVILALLMKQHPSISKFLWYLMALAGISYIIFHPLKVMLPGSTLVNNLEMILTLPMALGELALAVWFVWKGGKA